VATARDYLSVFGMPNTAIVSSLKDAARRSSRGRRIRNVRPDIARKFEN
jgi:hypothetical protein